MFSNIPNNDWAPLLHEEFKKPYFLQLSDFLNNEFSRFTIYPKREDIYNCLHYTPFHKVKVVIIGQDPYHGAGQAHGLSFSVPPGVAIPRSLGNILLELQNDLGYQIPNHGYLVKWAKQGVLLLNTVLTVRKGDAHSHRGKGWEVFTDQMISSLNKKDEPIVFLLWGRAAQQKISLIDTNKHEIITSSHPSPLAARKGFFGSKPFSKTNKLLQRRGMDPIDWEIPNLYD